MTIGQEEYLRGQVEPKVGSLVADRPEDYLRPWSCKHYRKWDGQTIITRENASGHATWTLERDNPEKSEALLCWWCWDKVTKNPGANLGELLG